MLILRMVVDDYVRSAEPVGSRTISKHAGLDLSAATVRNEMSDLEEMGYLEQPHASAGRIPSQLGYRFYVDHLIADEAHLTGMEVGRIRMLFEERIGELERVAQQAAVMLSELTRYTGVALGPRVYDTTMKSLQFVPLGDRSAVVLVITSSGQVQNRTVSVPEGVSGRGIEELFSILSAKLHGTPMYRIRSRILEEITSEMKRDLEDCEEAMRLLDQIVFLLDGEKDVKVFLGGATNMLEQPEFRDVQKVRPVLSWLEQPGHVAEALQFGDGRHAVSVRIGGENGDRTLQDCSLITATYEVGGVPLGAIGVIGPTRMEYARVIRLMSELSRGMTNLFSQAYGR